MGNSKNSFSSEDSCEDLLNNICSIENGKNVIGTLTKISDFTSDNLHILNNHYQEIDNTKNYVTRSDGDTVQTPQVIIYENDDVDVVYEAALKNVDLM